MKTVSPSPERRANVAHVTRGPRLGQLAKRRLVTSSSASKTKTGPTIVGACDMVGARKSWTSCKQNDGDGGAMEHCGKPARTISRVRYDMKLEYRAFQLHWPTNHSCVPKGGSRCSTRWRTGLGEGVKEWFPLKRGAGWYRQQDEWGMRGRRTDELCAPGRTQSPLA